MAKLNLALWNLGKGRSSRSVLAALRHRCCLSITTNGILRYESLDNARLSDMFCFTMQNDRDWHELLIVIFQLPAGKLLYLFCCLLLG